MQGASKEAPVDQIVPKEVCHGDQQGVHGPLGVLHLHEGAQRPRELALRVLRRASKSL